MRIELVKTAFKVADAVLFNEHSRNKIKFVYKNELFDEFGNALPKSILTDESGRVYLIVVDGVIKKIGGSQCKGGIKGTLSFYQGAMQGGPSIRTFGIHVLIHEALLEGKKVEVFMIVSKMTSGVVKGLFEEETIQIAAFKEMEDKCKKDFKSATGDLPEWNFQERGVSWRKDILLKHNARSRERPSFQ